MTRPGREVVARPAGVMGLETSTRDSLPCASSPELEFQLFDLWQSVPAPDTRHAGATVCASPISATVIFTISGGLVKCQPPFGVFTTEGALLKSTLGKVAEPRSRPRLAALPPRGLCANEPLNLLDFSRQS